MIQGTLACRTPESYRILGWLVVRGGEDACKQDVQTVCGYCSILHANVLVMAPDFSRSGTLPASPAAL